MPRTTAQSRTGSPAQLRLFADVDLRVQPPVESRLLRLSRRPPRPATSRERRIEEDRAAMERLRTWGRQLAGRFGLRWAALEAERDGVTEHYGICFADGSIRIRLRHAVTGRLLKESSLVDTLCHELAHLKHFDHSPRFWNYYRRILAEARRRGYYRPGPGRTLPRQGSLLDRVERTCGTGTDRGRTR